MIKNIIIAGIGGQGVLKASDILSDVVFRAGFDVKKAEVHGMSQRGGSVSCDVRFGEKVLSPMVPMLEADFLVLINQNQAEVVQHLISPKTVCLSEVAIDKSLLPNVKALNVAMLGLLSSQLEIEEEIWLAAIKAAFPMKLYADNLVAFNLGRSL